MSKIFFIAKIVKRKDGFAINVPKEYKRYFKLKEQVRIEKI